MPRTYKCSRCGFELVLLGDMKRHCLRKRPCNPTLSNAAASIITHESKKGRPSIIDELKVELKAEIEAGINRMQDVIHLAAEASSSHGGHNKETILTLRRDGNNGEESVVEVPT